MPRENDDEDKADLQHRIAVPKQQIERLEKRGASQERRAHNDRHIVSDAPIEEHALKNPHSAARIEADRHLGGGRDVEEQGLPSATQGPSAAEIAALTAAVERLAILHEEARARTKADAAEILTAAAQWLTARFRDQTANTLSLLHEEMEQAERLRRVAVRYFAAASLCALAAIAVLAGWILTALNPFSF